MNDAIKRFTMFTALFASLFFATNCDIIGGIAEDLTGAITGTGSSYCGNRMVETGEACDDGNINDADFCNNSCQFAANYMAVCGNGMVDQGESCDDGNQNNMDYCTNSCQFPTGYTPACGNGVMDPGEQCDDYNTVSGDGCSSTCTSEYSGSADYEPPVLGMVNITGTPTGGAGGYVLGDTITVSVDLTDAISGVYNSVLVEMYDANMMEYFGYCYATLAYGNTYSCSVTLLVSANAYFSGDIYAKISANDNAWNYVTYYYDSIVPMNYTNGYTAMDSGILVPWITVEGATLVGTLSPVVTGVTMSESAGVATVSITTSAPNDIIDVGVSLYDSMGTYVGSSYLYDGITTYTNPTLTITHSATSGSTINPGYIYLCDTSYYCTYLYNDPMYDTINYTENDINTGYAYQPTTIGIPTWMIP